LPTLFANTKAEDHLNKTAEVVKEIGAKGGLDMAYLDLGFLHEAKGEKAKSRECISTAIQVSEQ